MKKIWIAYVIAGIWALISINIASLNNNVFHPEMFQENPLGTLVGQTIFITAPFGIIWSYKQYKQYKIRHVKIN